MGGPAPVGRVWPWVLLGLSLALAGLVGVVVLALVVLGLARAGGGPDGTGDGASVGPAPARVVLAEDFATGPGPFDEYDELGFSAGVLDGQYVISSGDLQFTDWVTAVIAPVDGIDLRARVALAEASEAAAEVGLTVEGDQGGYALTISTGSGARISWISPTQEMVVVARGQALEVAAGELRIVVAARPDGAAQVTGYLDGQQVATYLDQWPATVFTEVGFAAYADAAPVTARFDDVVVRSASP